ncbi:MAG: hypothetical protein KDD82_02660 [Planctomycetes bacterium]|nr:hypothetical protein [Planctomycetota bacterium]
MSEAERPLPPPTRPEPTLSVEGAGTRCPYCHETVAVEEESWTVCAHCLARHHAGCWDEHGSCSTCAGTTPLTVGRAGPGRLPPLPEGAAQALDLGAAYRAGKALYTRENLPLFFAGALNMLLASAASVLIGGLTGAGLWSMTLGTLRGHGPGKLSDLFAHTSKYVPLLLGSLAVLLLTLLATPLLLVGGVLVSGGLGYTLPLIAERDLGVKDALKTSWRLARGGGLLKHALLTVLTTLPALVLVVPALGIVAFAALTPLVYGVWAAAYRQVTGEGPRSTVKGAGKGKDGGADEPSPEGGGAD